MFARGDSGDVFIGVRADPGAPSTVSNAPGGEPTSRREQSWHEQLWHEHADDLLRYATLLVGPDDAGDLVSLALERVARAATRPDAERSYLLRTVTNLAIDQSRSRQRRQARELKLAVTEHVATHESRVDVRRAVAALSVQQRAVVYHTYWEDLSSTQIAALLGISPSAVRIHLARAHVRLRKALP